MGATTASRPRHPDARPRARARPGASASATLRAAARARAGSPATRSASRSCTTTTSSAMLRDKRWHSATSQIMEMSGITDPEYLAPPADVDPVRRGRRAHPAAPARRQGVLAAGRRPAAAVHARGRSNGLVDAVAPHGRADIAVDICEPYPIPIICELLGAPKEDWKLFSRWATDVLRIFNGNLQEDLPTIVMAAQDELDEYTRGLIADAAVEAGRRPAHRPHRRRGGGRQAVDRRAGDDGRGGHRRRHRHDPQPARLRRRAVRRAPRPVGAARRAARAGAAGGRGDDALLRRRARARGGSPARTSSTGTCCSRPGTFIAPSMADGQLRRRRCSPTPERVRHHARAAPASRS